MATTTGKTIALLVLVALILLVGLRLTPLYIAPFGIFAGTIETIRDGVGSVHFGPWGFPFRSISFLSFLFLILWIVVIVWVYRDAERRGMNGVLWALLVLIGNVIGLIIYLILRTDYAPGDQNRAKSTGIKCPSCKKPVGGDFAYCPHCGHSLKNVCSKCGKSIESGWKNCPHCGTNLSA